MYYWIEKQIEQIGEQSHEFVDEVDEQIFRAMTQGRLLEIEFMLNSDMITGYLTKKEIDELSGYLKTVETIIF
jgi:hypothetical protein